MEEERKEEQEESRPEDSESLRVKTNVKAGAGRPEIPIEPPG
ncbi:MAG TPA: hypothetical protein VJS44_07685 [Pyrinomonadaceae bacterium]|nr:hypothetical protein [Pyrinomonadaceae bacterium]